ncbi:MAG TPA: hypothetical protein VGN72_20585 [Tepidisphaeraceae bacterium]|jgi:hypothetical protein|nr:hypothetical protein [Tepidisphaeraceae bacterium]
MNFRTLTLLVIVAAFSFGGSFQCRSGDDDDHDGDVVVTTP